VVPCDAPRTKIERVRSLGARVIERGQCFEESFAWATEEALRQGWRFLHAFDDPDVIAGQGTVALELLSMRPQLVLVPVGGGGLASGVSIVLRAAGIPVVGVQIEGVDAMASTLRGGPSRIQPRLTVADGLRVCEPGQLTRELCRGLDDMILVSEWEVRWAMRSLALQEGLRVEGAGAVAVAALSHVRGRRTVALVTGGNVDHGVLLEVMGTPSPQEAKLCI
jgi:threonine dehydratase